MQAGAPARRRQGSSTPAGSAPGYDVSGHQPFRPDIQGLRAVAVLLVIADHAGIAGFSGGYVGVDVFFVVSGYVITQLLLREAGKGVGTGLSDFYARRVRRIVPAATATLVGTVVVAWALLGSNLDPKLPGDVRWASLFVANWRFIETNAGYFVQGVAPSPITQFWSLGVEEQFYLCFPLVVLLIARFAPRARRIVLLQATLVVAVCLSAWWSAHISAGEPVAAYYSPFTRFWELGLGCLIATLTVRLPTRTARSEGIAVVLGPQSVYPGWLAWFPCAAAGLLVWAGGAGQRSAVSRLLASRPLRVIGDMSYSLYLAHYAWLVLPEELAPPLTTWPWRLLELAGTAVTAALSYHLLENPVRRSRALAKDRLATALVLLVCIASVWTASIVVEHVARLIPSP